MVNVFAELDFDVDECRWEEAGESLPKYEPDVWEPLYKPFGDVRTTPWTLRRSRLEGISQLFKGK